MTHNACNQSRAKRRVIQLTCLICVATLIGFWMYARNDTIASKNGISWNFLINRSARRFISEPDTDVHSLSLSQQFTINPESCGSLSVYPFLLIIAATRVNGSEIRKAIRETWGSTVTASCEVRLLFMVGRASEPKVQEHVEEEAAGHHDIIQSNQFNDTYSTATAKSLSLLQWAHIFCRRSVYTAKIDDDNWLNLPKYLRFLRSQQNTDFAFGALWEGAPVIRDPTDKNFVSKEDYKEDFYPNYMSGVLYTFPTRFLGKMLEVSREIPIILNEDVYICGLLAEKANITKKPAPDYAWSHDIHLTACPKRDKLCTHYTKIEDFYRLWNDICQKYEQIC